MNKQRSGCPFHDIDETQCSELQRKIIISNTDLSLLDIINEHPELISYIKHPTSEIQIAAITKSKYARYMIDEEDFCPDAELLWRMMYNS